jgi:small-conductance mechanosensitive channel
LQKSLDDYSVAYELNVYTKTAAQMMAIYSELHQHIQDRFNQAGVEIMSPAYSAVRDGNQVTIPQDHLPPAYQAPSFRVSLLDALRGAKPQVKPSDPDGA